MEDADSPSGILGHVGFEPVEVLAIVVAYEPFGGPVDNVLDEDLHDLAGPHEAS